MKDESCVDESPNQKEGHSIQSLKITNLVKVNDPTTNIMAENNIQLRQSKDLKPIQKSYHSFDLDEAGKISNGLVMLINQYASQLFEIHNNIFKMICHKPRRIYKYLAREY